MSPLLAGLLAGSLAAAGIAASTPVFSFADPDIAESSGLVDLGDLMVTTNDSGDGPVLYVVDPRTGETVGRTTYADTVTDVEALAPAGKNHVWVGDIGDNTESRRTVQVYRVPVGRGDRTVTAPAYDLVYPDGAHDAESLVLGPDGRLRIITKGILGGQVFVAPQDLAPDRPNRLRPGPSVGLFATDAALFPDGRHVLVRGYASAQVARFPSFEVIGRFGLPDQEQGEGVSIGGNGRIRLSSEGEGSSVLQIRLPADVREALAASSADPSPSTAPGLDETGAIDDDAPGLDGSLLLGLAAACLAGGAVVVFRGRRRHRPAEQRRAS